MHLKQVGPAHTRGDTIVHVPSEKLVFTGDILFIEGHPILWVGPVGNWIDACNYINGLDVDTIVPGHGPITDKRGVIAVRDYLVYVRDQARLRFDAGMNVYDAARDISLTDYDSWGDAERIVVNVATLYKEFSGDATPNNITELFGLMAKLHRVRRSAKIDAKKEGWSTTPRRFGRKTLWENRNSLRGSAPQQHQREKARGEQYEDARIGDLQNVHGNRARRDGHRDQHGGDYSSGYHVLHPLVFSVLRNRAHTSKATSVTT